MKKKLLIVLLIPALICYVAFSFIQWDFNPSNWHIVSRFIFFLFYAILVMAMAKAEQDNL